MIDLALFDDNKVVYRRKNNLMQLISVQKHTNLLDYTDI